MVLLLQLFNAVVLVLMQGFAANADDDDDFCC